MADRRVRVILEAVTTNFTRGMQQARAQIGGLLSQASKNRTELTKLGLAMAGFGVLTTKALLGAGRESAKFNAEITKLTTQVGIARNEAAGLGAAAAGLGIAAGRGPMEMAEALFFVASAGLRGGDALEVLNASAKASAIGLGETKVVADLVTSAVNAYGIETLSASQATDILIGAVREGKAEAPALAGALGRVLPIASEMGVRFDEVGAAVAAMTRTGTDASTATTQLRAVLVGLLKPAQGVEREMEALGFSSQRVRDIIQQDGLWAALMALRDAAGDNEAAIGRLFPNVRALAGFLDLTGANAAANATVFESLADSTGNLADGFAEWALTTEAAQQRFSAAMEAARISVGGDLEPSMRAALDTGTGLALLFAEMPDPLRQAGTGIAGVAAGLATVAGGGALALVALSHVHDAMKNLNISGAGLLRFAVHPLTLGFGLLAAAVLLTAKRKAELRRDAETLRTILGDEADAVLRAANAYDRLSDTQQTQLAEDLVRRHEDLLDVLDATGVTLGDFVAALFGEEQALARVNAAIEAHTKVTEIQGQGITNRSGAGQDLLKILGRERDVTDEARKAQEQFNTVGGEGADAADELGGEIDELNPLLGDLAGEMEDVASETELATDALREYLDEQRAATDPVFGMTKSLRDQKDAQEAVNEARDKFGKGSSEHVQALEDLAQANFDVESAAAAVAEHGLQPMIAALDQMVAQGSLSRGEADLLIEKFKAAAAAGEDFTGEYVAQLIADVDEAKIADAEQAMEDAARERVAKVLPNLDGRRAGEVDRDLNRIADPRDPQYLPNLDGRRAGDVSRNLNRIADPRSPQYRPRVDSGSRARTRTRLNDLSKTRSALYRPLADAFSRSRVEGQLNFLARRRSATISVGYAVSGGIPAGLTRGHSGGMVTPTGIKRMHDGGQVGNDGASLLGNRLAPDEVPAILQTRERVLSREQNAALERLVRMVGNTAQASGPSFHAGGTVAAGPEWLPSQQSQRPPALRMSGDGAIWEMLKYADRTGKVRLTDQDGRRVRIG